MKLVLLLNAALFITSCGNNIHEVPADIKVPTKPLNSCPDSPNCFITTQYFEEDSSLVFSALETTIEEMNAHEVEITSTGKAFGIDATFKIPVFGWIDDVSIIVESYNKNLPGSFVHLRSSSREGYSDLGVNKRRINKILKTSRKKLNAQ